MGLKMRLFTLSPSVTLRPPQSVSEQSRLAAKPMKDTRIGEDGFVIGQRKNKTSARYLNDRYEKRDDRVFERDVRNSVVSTDQNYLLLGNLQRHGKDYGERHKRYGRIGRCERLYLPDGHSPLSER